MSCTATAPGALRRGDVDEGRRLVEPLLSRRRMHRGEFEALGGIEMELQLALDDRTAAGRWLDILREFSPEHPALESWRSRIEGGGVLRLLGRAIGPKR
jgi:hypothetical protein